MAVTFAVYLYEGTEPIDLATFGVLSMARRVEPAISMHTVSERAGPVELANGLTVLADHGFDDWPGADVLIVTGGPGWSAQCERPWVLEFLRNIPSNTMLASVCTGGMILAASGALAGGRATTKRRVIPPEESPLALLRARHPDIETVEATLVDDGKTITSGGVTLCIDATLHLLSRYCGARVASETARILEYDNAWRANSSHFKPETADA